MAYTKNDQSFIVFCEEMKTSRQKARGFDFAPHPDAHRMCCLRQRIYKN